MPLPENLGALHHSPGPTSPALKVQRGTQNAVSRASFVLPKWSLTIPQADLGNKASFSSAGRSSASGASPLPAGLWVGETQMPGQEQ